MSACCELRPLTDCCTAGAGGHSCGAGRCAAAGVRSSQLCTGCDVLAEDVAARQQEAFPVHGAVARKQGMSIRCCGGCVEDVWRMWICGEDANCGTFPRHWRWSPPPQGGCWAVTASVSVSPKFRLTLSKYPHQAHIWLGWWLFYR